MAINGNSNPRARSDTFIVIAGSLTHSRSHAYAACRHYAAVRTVNAENDVINASQRGRNRARLPSFYALATRHAVFSSSYPVARAYVRACIQPLNIH